MWQKTDNVREQTVLRKCWFLSDWLSASTDGSRLKSIFCMQTTVFCPFFLHFSHISVNSDVLSLAVGHQKPVPQAKSHWGVFCCPGTDGSPLTAHQGGWLFYTKKTCSPLLGRSRTQSSGHSNPFHVHRALSDSPYISEAEFTRFQFLHPFARTGGPFPEAFLAPGDAAKAPVTAHDGIEVILAFVRANQSAWASEQILIQQWYCWYRHKLSHVCKNKPSQVFQPSARICISLSLAACPGSGISEPKLMKTV